MGDAMLATNPWQSNQELVKDIFDCEGKVYTHEKALQEIAYFLLQWPGTQTANAPLEERHSRFVQVIGGYPSINGRFPLDWPLHPESIRALRLSLYLDTIACSNDTSLRSRILDRDLEYRRDIKIAKSDDEKEELLIAANHECVADLLRGLRLHIGDCKNNTQTLSISEEHFLISLHSLDAQHLVRFWPWEKLATELDTRSRYPTKPPFTKPEGPHIGKLVHKYGKDSDQVLIAKEQLAEWENFEKFNIQVDKLGSLSEVRFEYKFIQTWMYKHWLKCWFDQSDSKGVDSIGQRLLRGLSTVCELAMSRIRQEIISKYGLGVIIVDGGGRISFTVPSEEVRDAKDTIQTAFEKMFLLRIGSGQRLPFLEHDIRQALTCHLPIGKRQEDSKGVPLTSRFLKDGDRPNGNDYQHHLGANFVRQCMPPRRIYQFNKDQENPIPEIDHISPTECKFCNCDDDIEWPNVAKRMKNHEYQICMMHRLLFFIGTNQRIRDSILRLPLTQMGYNIGTQGKSDSENLRRVHSIATLDGNSFGIFFQQDRQANNDLHEFDIVRRRSFRFNVKWYQSLHDGFESTTRFGADRVAAWVCAGDDIVLAQYSSKSSDAPMLRFLSKLSESLEKDDEIQQQVTFAGGLAIRRKPTTTCRAEGCQNPLSEPTHYSEMISCNDPECTTKSKPSGGLRTAVQESIDNEKIAKHLWKTNIQTLGKVEYIEEDGVRKQFDNTLTPSTSDIWFGEKTPSSLIVKETDERNPMESKSNPRKIIVKGIEESQDYDIYIRQLHGGSGQQANTQEEGEVAIQAEEE